MKSILIASAFLMASLCPAVAAAEGSDAGSPLVFGVAAPGVVGAPLAQPDTNGLSFSLTCPGSRDFALTAPTSTCFGLGRLNWTLALATGSPTNVQVLVFVKDWDYLWYQRLLPGYVVPGSTNRFSVDLSPSALDWEPRGHHAIWNARALMQPRQFGIRIFCDGAGSITGTLGTVSAEWLPPDTSAPTIRDVRPAANRVTCYEKFEVAFDLPDRYANPFDPEEVSVTATFETPDGKTVQIDGFHYRNYYRLVGPTGEETLPQGTPHWKVRFAPTQPGTYRYRLHVRDTRGVADWGPGSFVALPPSQPGYIRVARKDVRFFEFDNGNPFFPIGHNIRSPSDERLNSQFPWAKRWVEGTAAYTRYFTTMHEYGENMAEVWMAAWSLGLEWSPQWRGYHGLGQYNLMNAWEMDRVLDEADRNGLYLNVVINNHGRLTGRNDAEWAHNPLNTKMGGFLESPDQFFADPRAWRAFQNLMRYTIARWGYSPRVFAWELWSELNLVGTNDQVYRQQSCVDWHRKAAAMVRDLDPNHHLITTHYSNDYTSQNTAITALPEISHASVDAYHGNPQPLHIVELLTATARFNNPFNKPVMVTEFGGSWDAQGLGHLENSLHAGLWASTCIPIAGTPLFWWWGLIEEENYYPEYLAISRFMKGEDRRDPALVEYAATLALDGETSDQFQSRSMKSGTHALGWIYDTAAYGEANTEPHRTVTNLVIRLDGMSNGVYQVEFWGTAEGTLVDQKSLTVKDGIVSAKVPPFSRDVAFKLKPR